MTDAPKTRESVRNAVAKREAKLNASGIRKATLRMGPEARQGLDLLAAQLQVARDVAVEAAILVAAGGGAGCLRTEAAKVTARRRDAIGAD